MIVLAVDVCVAAVPASDRIGTHDALVLRRRRRRAKPVDTKFGEQLVKFVIEVDSQQRSISRDRALHVVLSENPLLQVPPVDRIESDQCALLGKCRNLVTGVGKHVNQPKRVGDWRTRIRPRCARPTLRS